MAPRRRRREGKDRVPERMSIVIRTTTCRRRCADRIKVQVPRNSSGSFAKFAAIRPASTLVMIAILVQGNERRP
jgi:hypothetical protein